MVFCVRKPGCGWLTMTRQRVLGFKIPFPAMERVGDSPHQGREERFALLFGEGKFVPFCGARKKGAAPFQPGRETKLVAPRPRGKGLRLPTGEKGKARPLAGREVYWTGRRHIGWPGTDEENMIAR